MPGVRKRRILIGVGDVRKVQGARALCDACLSSRDHEALVCERRRLSVCTGVPLSQTAFVSEVAARMPMPERGLGAQRNDERSGRAPAPPRRRAETDDRAHAVLLVVCFFVILCALSRPRSMVGRSRRGGGTQLLLAL